MRSSIVVMPLLLLLVALGMLQAVSDALALSAAQRGSLIALLPHDLGARYAVLPAQRLLAARNALALGDAAEAERQISGLPFTPDRRALEGRLAEVRGDQRAAIAAYLFAGDFESLAGEVTRMEASGKDLQALRIQLEIVRRLEQIRTQPDALADAWWRLGQVYAKLGYHQGGSKRNAYRRLALDSYEHALALAPFSQTYLLNAGYEAFDLGDLTRAGALFARARDADPKSVNALVGLGRIAFLRRDGASARAYLAAARSIDPTLPDVLRLARQVGE